MMRRATVKGLIVYDFNDNYDEFLDLAVPWVRDGKMKLKEDIVEGLENLPGHFVKLMSLYWAGAVAAYVWGIYTTGTLETSIQWWGLFLVVLVLPIVFIWLVSLIAKRSQDLKAEANHLAAIALRLTHPEDQASREITRLGHGLILAFWSALS